MKRYFQAYHIFLPRSSVLIKIMIYGIYPLFNILLSLAGGNLMGEIIGSFLMAGMLLLFSEFIIELFTFSGIASEDGIRLEYIKSSPRGIRFVKKGLTANALRRAVTILLVYVVLYVVTIKSTETGMTGSMTAGMMTAAALVTIFLTEAATLVTKFFSGLYVAYFTGVVASLLQILCLLGILMSRRGSVLLVLLLGISDAAIVLMSCNIVMGRIRRSYYDE